MLVVLLVYQQFENNILTPKIQGKAVNLSGVLHHRLRHAVRSAARRPRRAHRGPLAAMIQIFVQELTKARRERVAAAKAALQPAPMPSAAGDSSVEPSASVAP